MGASPHDKSPAERVFHAVAYEVVAILACAPLFAWLTGQSVERMGAFNAGIAVLAVLWNMAVTRAQDRLLAARGRAKTWGVRAAHAVVCNWAHDRLRGRRRGRAA